MRKDVPHTWNNERWVTDRLVAAVDEGDTVAKERFGQRLLDGIGEDGWRSWRFVDEGFFVRFADLDPANMLGEDLDELCEKQVVSRDREPLIMEGAPLAGKELERWREIVIDRAFAPECATYWIIFEFKDDHARGVYVAATSRPDSGRPVWRHPLSFVAAYSMYSESQNALKAQGFVGRKDCQARSSEVFGEKVVSPGVAFRKPG